MKTLLLAFLVLSVAIIDFTGCRKKDDNPIGITDSATVGKAALSGRVILPEDRIDRLSVHVDSGSFNGVKVELLNSSLHTETDENGFWRIQNLDSGSYSIRITKQGYDTVIINNITLKNKDSVYIGSPQNQIIVQWADIVLNEQITATIINPSAQIDATILREYKDPRDSTKVVNRDMRYDFSAEIGIEVRGLTLKSWDKTAYDIAYSITNSPIIDLQDYPVLAYGLKSTLSANLIWNFVNYRNETNKISKTGVYSISLNNKENISTIANRYKFDLTNKEQLYLHILPLWHQWARKDYGLQDYEYWKRGDVVSISIQWR